MNENIKARIFILMLGVLIGASGYLANSLYLWNTSVNKDKEISFVYLLFLKTRESAYLLTGKNSNFTFISSKFTFKHQDSDGVLRKILNVSYAELANNGVFKWYRKQEMLLAANARNIPPS